MFGLGEGDFEPCKRIHKFVKGNLTFLNQQATLNNIFVNINKNILPNIQQMQIALSFLKTNTGSSKMMLKSQTSTQFQNIQNALSRKDPELPTLKSYSKYTLRKNFNKLQSLKTKQKLL